MQLPGLDTCSGGPTNTKQSVASVVTVRIMTDLILKFFHSQPSLQFNRKRRQIWNLLDHPSWKLV